jgi:hypothetical protein
LKRTLEDRQRLKLAERRLEVGRLLASNLCAYDNEFTIATALNDRVFVFRVDHDGLKQKKMENLVCGRETESRGSPTILLPKLQGVVVQMVRPIFSPSRPCSANASSSSSAASATSNSTKTERDTWSSLYLSSASARAVLDEGE